MTHRDQEPRTTVMPLPGDADWDEELWRNRAIEVMNSRDFGWYCHEGGDILEDLLSFYHVRFDPENVNGINSLEWLLSRLVYEIEEANCKFCSRENNVGKSDDPADYLEEALFSLIPGSPAEEVVYIACNMAEVRTGISAQPIQELTRVAQDLINHDPRKEN